MTTHTACRNQLHQSLNAQQHEAVHLGDGRYVLAATAGSGKTRVAVLRTAQLLEDGVLPSRIGVFTFAKDAANEMLERGRSFGFPKDLRIGTLHSLCWEILRKDGEVWNGPNLTPDDTALFRALKEILSRDFRDQELDPGVATSLIGLAKANCLSVNRRFGNQNDDEILQLFKERADRPWLARVYLQVYKKLESIREERALVSFDDMLLLGWRTLMDSELARNKWSNSFDYIMVDEAQDSSKVQNAVVDILAENTSNVMLIGDIQQSLYSWRGALPQQFYDYAKKYTTLSLPVNYRSTKQICASATILTANKAWNVTGGTLAHSEAVDDPKSVSANEYENADAEAEAIALDIQKHLTDGVPPGEIAVLYRVTWLVIPIEAALLKAKIPYVVWSGMNFYERKEVRDLLAYLRVAALRDPDETQVKRAIHAPFRYLGKVYVNDVENHARANGMAFVTALKDFQSAKPSQTRNGQKFYELLMRLNKKIAAGVSAANALDFVTSETNYMSYLKKDEGEDGPDPDSGRAANVQQLFKMAQKFGTVIEFLDYVDAMTATLNAARGNKNPDAVVLSSIHRAKGLEWHYVYGAGWNEGTLPHIKNPDQDEELRLAYVCLTRAQKMFQASWCRTVIAPKGEYEGEPSRFIQLAQLPTVKLLPKTQFGDWQPRVQATVK